MKKLTALLLTVILLITAFSFSAAEEAAKIFDPSVFADFPYYEYDKFEKKWSCITSMIAVDKRENRGITIAFYVQGTAGEKPGTVVLALTPAAVRNGKVEKIDEVILGFQIVADDRSFIFDNVLQQDASSYGTICLGGRDGLELVKALAGAETVHVRYLTEGNIVREYPNVSGEFAKEMIPFCRVLVENDYFSCADLTLGDAYEEKFPSVISQIHPVTETKDDPASPVYMIADQYGFTLNPFDNTWEYVAYYTYHPEEDLIYINSFVRGSDYYLNPPLMEFGLAKKDNSIVYADTVNLIADNRLFIIKTHDGILYGVEEGREMMDALLTAKEIAVRITLTDGTVITIDPVNMEDFAPIIHFFEVLRDAGYDAKISEADREEGIKRFRENCSVTVR